MAKKEYFLCSAAVIEHFPDFEKSRPFKSGYDYDKDEVYYVAMIDFDKVNAYYKRVIEPYNEKSNVADIDFWCRECTESLVDEAPEKCLTKCRRDGVFVTIEKLWGLTNEKNRAYGIYKMAQYYLLNPIEFINKVTN